MKKMRMLTALCVLALAGTAYATVATPQAKPAPAGEPRPAVKESQLAKVSATVEAIDYKTRMVTLKGTDGTTVTFRAGEEVKRLNEVKKGDTVIAQYYESIAYEVLPAGAETHSKAEMIEAEGRADASEPPAGAVVQKMHAVVTITAIDTKAETVTIKGPEGNLLTVKARHPENLQKIKVGDKVSITYTEALAISLEPAKPADTAKPAAPKDTK